MNAKNPLRASLISATLLLAAQVAALHVIHAAGPEPTPHPAGDTSGLPVANSKLPPFLQVGSVYIFDGNEDDLVKVLELTWTSWIRVQTKAGESWVNVDNLTTITPVSKEEAAKTEMKERADFIRDGAMAISNAIDDYAAKKNLPMDATFKWEDIRKFLKSDSPIYNSGGKDITGRPYILGPKLGDHVKVSPETIQEVSPVIEDPADYWGKFKS